MSLMNSRGKEVAWSRQLAKIREILMAVRFLIAEDQRAQQKLLANVVLFLGGESRFASNGREALQIAEEEPFDIVLMDLHMPEMDGLETADRLLHHWSGHTQRPRIVVVSGNASPDCVALCRSVGMDGYIMKPYSTTALRRSLQEVVTRGYCWTDGSSRRLLHLRQLSQVLKADLETYVCESQAAKHALQEFAADESLFSTASCASKLTALESFARKHGFLSLQAAMQEMLAPEMEHDAYVMSTRCADELESLNFVLKAVEGWQAEALPSTLMKSA
jgi:CheY-like chemotaxis protein